MITGNLPTKDRQVLAGQIWQPIARVAMILPLQLLCQCGQVGCQAAAAMMRLPPQARAAVRLVLQALVHLTHVLRHMTRRYQDQAIGKLT
jgi:hypothetical protein